VSIESRRRHDELNLIGFRARATAAGLVQLCIELRRCGFLDGPALEHIQDAMVDELLVGLSPRRDPAEERQRLLARLRRLLAVDVAVTTPPHSVLAARDAH